MTRTEDIYTTDQFYDPYSEDTWPKDDGPSRYYYIQSNNYQGLARHGVGYWEAVLEHSNFIQSTLYYTRCFVPVFPRGIPTIHTSQKNRKPVKLKMITISCNGDMLKIELNGGTMTKEEAVSGIIKTLYLNLLEHNMGDFCTHNRSGICSKSMIKCSNCEACLADKHLYFISAIGTICELMKMKMNGEIKDFDCIIDPYNGTIEQHLVPTLPEESFVISVELPPNVSTEDTCMEGGGGNDL